MLRKPSGTFSSKSQSASDMNVVKNVKVSVGVSVSGGLLDLEIDTQEISRQELLDALKRYRVKAKYFRLKNGGFLKLENENMQMLSEMMDTLQISSKDFLKENIHLPVYRTLYLNRLLEENETVYHTRDSHFREMVKSCLRSSCVPVICKAFSDGANFPSSSFQLYTREAGATIREVSGFSSSFCASKKAIVCSVLPSPISSARMPPKP